MQVVIVVILDIFARAAHTDARAHILMHRLCRISVNLRTIRHALLAGSRVVMLEIFKHVHVTIVIIRDICARSAHTDAREHI